MRLVGFFLMFLVAAACFAQSHSTDSLERSLEQGKDDSSRVKTLNALAGKLISSEPEKAAGYARQSFALAEKLGFRKGAGNACQLLGRYEYLKGNKERALVYLHKGLDHFKSIGNKAGIAKLLANVGIIYRSQSNYPKALNCYFQTLKLATELKDTGLETMALGNIGNIYMNQRDFKTALRYLMQAYEKASEGGHLENAATNLGNIAIVYEETGDISSAEKYYKMALDMTRKSGNRNGEAIHLGNLGNLYALGPDTKKALDYFLQSYAIIKEMGDQTNLASLTGNIGLLYKKVKKYREAEYYLKLATTITDSLHMYLEMADFERAYSNLDSILGNYSGALLHYKRFVAARDSVTNEENTKKQTRLEMQFDFDKKEAATKAEQEKRDAVAAADKKRQNIILLSVTGFGLLVLGFAVFAYRSFLQKKKANEEISKQKELIEEKQKEILDSIYYARRIQRSLITSEKYIQKKLAKLVT